MPQYIKDNMYSRGVVYTYIEENIYCMNHVSTGCPVWMGVDLYRVATVALF